MYKNNASIFYPQLVKFLIYAVDLTVDYEDTHPFLESAHFGTVDNIYKITTLLDVIDRWACVPDALFIFNFH